MRGIEREKRLPDSTEIQNRTSVGRFSVSESAEASHNSDASLSKRVGSATLGSGNCDTRHRRTGERRRGWLKRPTIATPRVKDVGNATRELRHTLTTPRRPTSCCGGSNIIRHRALMVSSQGMRVSCRGGKPVMDARASGLRTAAAPTTLRQTLPDTGFPAPMLLRHAALGEWTER